MDKEENETNLGQGDSSEDARRGCKIFSGNGGLNWIAHQEPSRELGPVRATTKRA